MQENVATATEAAIPVEKFHHKLLVFKGIMGYHLPKKQFFLMLLILSFVNLHSASRATSTLSDIDIVLKLRQLKPLPKVHYSWGLRGDLLDSPYSRLIYELARITHAVSVSGQWVTQQQVANAVYICATVNKAKPKIPCTMAINLSPWHYKFGKDLPPTDRGLSYYAEIAYVTTRLKNIKQWVEEANKKYGSDVAVGALLFDCERFHIKEGDTRWNEAIRRALDTIHQKGQEIFPNTRIEWYGRGVGRVWGGDGWGMSPYFTGKEIKPSLSCSLYTLPELQRMRETFRRTCKLADELKITEVTPWVALASGYRRGLKRAQYFDLDWRYDLIYSYQMGAELNIAWYSERPERFAPYGRAKVVIFYPAPFDSRTPHWGKHFIAYVRGSNGVETLEDLGYEE